MVTQLPIRWLQVVSLVTVLCACGDARPPSSKWPDTDAEAQPGTLYLEVANESFADNPIHLAVELDGKTVFDGSLDTEDPLAVAPTQHARIQLHVAPGTHEISCRSNPRQAMIVKGFDMTGAPLWCDVSYFYNPGGKFGVPKPAHLQATLSPKRPQGM